MKGKKCTQPRGKKARITTERKQHMKDMTKLADEKADSRNETGEQAEYKKEIRVDKEEQ